MTKAPGIGDVSKARPLRPRLPGDLTRSSKWLVRGRSFRHSEECSGYSGCRANKIDLINAVDDTQWGYLYHYGFIPIIVPDLGTFRIHWRHGNNVSYFKPRLAVGLCCYVNDFNNCVDGQVLMQLLSLRTNPGRFVKTACTAVSAESRYEGARYAVMYGASGATLCEHE